MIKYCHILKNFKHSSNKIKIEKYFAKNKETQEEDLSTPCYIKIFKIYKEKINLNKFKYLFDNCCI